MLALPTLGQTPRRGGDLAVAYLGLWLGEGPLRAGNKKAARGRLEAQCCRPTALVVESVVPRSGAQSRARPHTQSWRQIGIAIDAP